VLEHASSHRRQYVPFDTRREYDEWVAGRPRLGVHRHGDADVLRASESDVVVGDLSDILDRREHVR
jgi:hypothetical protein